MHTLSVGERQRVEIVRALLTEPEAADPRRADLGADAAGGREAVRHAAPARRARAARSSTSATSSTRSARCAPLHGAARRPGHRRGRPAHGDQRQPVAADDRRRAAAAAAPRGARRARWCSRCAACRLPSEDPFGIDLDGHRASRCAPARSSASPASRATASRSCWPRCRARTRARRRARSACSARHRARTRRAGAARAGLHFVPEERLGRGAVPTLVAGAEHAAHAQRAGRRAAAGCAAATVSALAAGADRALRRQGRRARTRRRRACRAATCRSSSSAARSTPRPKLLIVAQPTWGVDVGAAAQIRGELLALRDAGCARAGGQRGARRAVRDLRPPGRDRAGPRLAERGRPPRRRIEQIGEWMSGLWDAQRRSDRRPPCSGLRRAREPSRLMSIASPLLALAITVRDRRAAVRAARQGPAARPRRCSSSSRCESALRAGRAGGQGDAADADRARPGGLLSRQRLEHRRRGPVHPRRDRRRRRRDAGRPGHRALDRRRRCCSPASLGGMALGGDRRAAARPLQRQRDPGQPDAGLRRRAAARATWSTGPGRTRTATTSRRPSPS